MERSAAHPGLITFDAPDGTVSCTRRVRSNTPLQALILLNDDTYFEFAEVLGKRILSDGAGLDDRGKLSLAFDRTLQRALKPAEGQRLLAFLAAQRDSQKEKSEPAAWTAVARVLLNLDEFMTRE